MRRRADALLPSEHVILDAVASLHGMGLAEVHGFQLARTMADQAGAKRLTGYGSLYRALDRLEGRGLVERRWEDPFEAAAAGRPRRRYYRLTAAGHAARVPGAAEDAARQTPQPNPRTAS
jgi:PadR family transcriptional regulator PadR